MGLVQSDLGRSYYNSQKNKFNLLIQSDLGKIFEKQLDLENTMWPILEIKCPNLKEKSDVGDKVT